jgi:hypothetical protein
VRGHCGRADPLLSGRNGGTPVYFLGQAALRRKQCDMSAETGTVERKETAVVRQRNSKYLSVAKNI